jgi:hypothetical protein
LKAFVVASEIARAERSVLPSFRQVFLTLFLSDQYKEDNRNLGIILRDLRIQFSDSQATVQRLEIEKERLARQLNEACDASDRHENEDQWLKNG